MQSNIFSSAIVNIFISCVQDHKIKQNLVSLLQYYDYTTLWYLEYGTQIIINFIVMTFLPHSIYPLYEILLHKIKVYYA